jgi:hypothetical protein
MNWYCVVTACCAKLCRCNEITAMAHSRAEAVQQILAGYRHFNHPKPYIVEVSQCRVATEINSMN